MLNTDLVSLSQSVIKEKCSFCNEINQLVKRKMIIDGFSAVLEQT